MSYRFELKLADGDDAGRLETSEGNWQVGDTLIAHGNVHYRVTAVVPVERIAEFVEEPTNGVLEVEPL
ncbi:MAG TPA: hypothetical protein VH108_01900 [Gaiellaceae bacterium]|nr:hypothetical protein [Gaiellaceae bacterium]